jgi:hypothetical protein
LAEEKRLVVPGQAVREFYKHRAQKVAGISEVINGAIQRLKKPAIDRMPPLLEDDAEFKAAQALMKDAASKSREAVEKLIAVQARLQADIGSDPVSLIYRKHLTKCVVDEPLDKAARQRLAHEVERRGRLRIAPGFKDQGKEDGGIGDLLVWHAVLEEGKRRKGNCLFVTNEEKNDWWVKSGGAFQPRPELLDEYRQVSDGGTVHLLQLSGLLSLLAADPEAVQDVQNNELAARNVRLLYDLGRKALEHESFSRTARKQRILEIQTEQASFQDRLGLINNDLLRFGDDSLGEEMTDEDEHTEFMARLMSDRLLINSRLESLDQQLKHLYEEDIRSDQANARNWRSSAGRYKIESPSLL